MLLSDERKIYEGMGWAGGEGKNNGCNKMTCGGKQWYGERDNEISKYGEKTKELNESYTCVALSLKEIKVYCHNDNNILICILWVSLISLAMTILVQIFIWR